MLVNKTANWIGRFQRNLRQKFDLIVFVWRAQQNPAVFLIIPFVPTLIALATLVVRYAFALAGGFEALDWLLITFASGSLAYNFYGFWKRLLEHTRPSRHHAHAIIKTSLAKAISINGKKVDFGDIKSYDLKHGVGTFSDLELCSEYAHSSRIFDDTLLQSQTLKVSKTEKQSRSALAANLQTREKQLQYVDTRVRESKGRLPTINEAKCGIDLNMEKQSCTLYKTSYFDALCSNDAFRSVLTAVDETSGVPDHDEWQQDLTSLFPAELSNDLYFLNNARGSAIANTVGATSIVITSDGQVVFFRQGETQISPRAITASSGSMDWDDRMASADSGNYIDAVKHGMVREFCEESSAYKKYRKRGHRKFYFFVDKKRVHEELMASTLVTGFFRWVNRCGKPEFIGVTWTALSSVELSADQKEVAGLPAFVNLSVRTLLDLEEVYRRLVDFCKKDGNGAILSTVMALVRLCEIANDANSTDSVRRQNYQLVQKILRLE